MSSTLFYKEIPHLENLNEISNLDKLQNLPEDWYLIITDIVNSTIAIENNLYKDVNTVGGLSIVSITNLQKDLDLPFIFGGDGVTVCIPPELYEQALSALSHTAKVSEKEFKLKLRVGIVPLKDIYADNKTIQVAKLKVSPRYNQTIFLGTGIDYAEGLIKKDPNSKYLIPMIENSEADYSGFSCRWKAIPSLHGEMVSIIIKARNTELNSADKFYDTVINTIDKIFGGEESYHPVVAEKLELSMSAKKLNSQAKIEAKGFFKRFLLVQKFRIEHFLLNLLMRFAKDLVVTKGGADTSVKASEVKLTIRKTSDFRKFDGSLKMVISGSSSAREKLVAYLENLYKEKKLSYGVHVSKDALMTCLLFADTDSEVHFIDGADGGYALAAKDFKKRLSSFN